MIVVSGRALNYLFAHILKMAPVIFLAFIIQGGTKFTEDNW